MPPIRLLSHGVTQGIEASHHFPGFSSVVEALDDVVHGLSTVYYTRMLCSMSLSGLPSSPCAELSLRQLHQREVLAVQLYGMGAHLVHDTFLVASGAVVSRATSPTHSPATSTMALPVWLDLSELGLLAEIVESIDLQVHLLPVQCACLPRTLLSVSWLHGRVQPLRASVPSIPHGWILHNCEGCARSTPPDEVGRSGVSTPLRLRVDCRVTGVFYSLPVRRAAFCGGSGATLRADSHLLAQTRSAEQRRMWAFGFRRAVVAAVAPLYLLPRVHSAQAAASGVDAPPTTTSFELELNRCEDDASPDARYNSHQSGLKYAHVVLGTSDTATCIGRRGGPTLGEALSREVVRAFYPSCLPRPSAADAGTRAGEMFREITVLPGRFVALFWSRHFLDTFAHVTRIGAGSRRRRRRQRAASVGRCTEDDDGDDKGGGCARGPAPLTSLLIVSRVPDSVLVRAAKANHAVSEGSTNAASSSSAFCYLVDDKHEVYRAVRRHVSVQPFLICVDPQFLDGGGGVASGHRHWRGARCRPYETFERCFAEAVNQFQGNPPTVGDDEKTQRTSAPVAGMPKATSPEQGRARAAAIKGVTSTLLVRMRKGSLRHRDATTSSSCSPRTRTRRPIEAVSRLRFQHLVHTLSRAQALQPGRLGEPRGSGAVEAAAPMPEASLRRSASAALARASTCGTTRAGTSLTPSALVRTSRPRRTPVVLCANGKGLRDLAVAPGLVVSGRVHDDLADLRRLLGTAASRHAADDDFAARQAEDVSRDAGTPPEPHHAAWEQAWSQLIRAGFAAPHAWLPSTTTTAAESDHDTRCPLVQHDRLAKAQVAQWDRRFLVIVMPHSPTSATPVHCRTSPLPAATALTSVKQNLTWWLADQHAVHERVRLEWFLTFAEAYVWHGELDARAAVTAAVPHLHLLSQQTGGVLAQRIVAVKQLVAQLSAATTDTPPVIADPQAVGCHPLPNDLIDEVSRLEPILMTWGWRFGHAMRATLTDGGEAGGAATASAGLRRACVSITQWPRLLVESMEFALRSVQDLRWMVEELASTHSGGGAEGVPGSSAVVPSAVLQFFISRSCRGAVMFGDCLSAKAARTLVEAMSTTSQYYLCSHGRPCLCRLQPHCTC